MMELHQPCAPCVNQNIQNFGKTVAKHESKINPKYENGADIEEEDGIEIIDLTQLETELESSSDCFNPKSVKPEWNSVLLLSNPDSNSNFDRDRDICERHFECHCRRPFCDGIEDQGIIHDCPRQVDLNYCHPNHPLHLPNHQPFSDFSMNTNPLNSVMNLHNLVMSSNCVNNAITSPSPLYNYYGQHCQHQQSMAIVYFPNQMGQMGQTGQMEYPQQPHQPSQVTQGLGGKEERFLNEEIPKTFLPPPANIPTPSSPIKPLQDPRKRRIPKSESASSTSPLPTKSPRRYETTPVTPNPEDSTKKWNDKFSKETLVSSTTKLNNLGNIVEDVHFQKLLDEVVNGIKATILKRIKKQQMFMDDEGFQKIMLNLKVANTRMDKGQHKSFGEIMKLLRQLDRPHFDLKFSTLHNEIMPVVLDSK